jgi:hypothetical protein
MDPRGWESERTRIFVKTRDQKRKLSVHSLPHYMLRLQTIYRCSWDMLMIATARVDSVVTFPSEQIPNLDVLRAHGLRWVKNFRHPSRVFQRVKGCFSHARLPGVTYRTWKIQIQSSEIKFIGIRKRWWGGRPFCYVAQSPPKEIPQATMWLVSIYLTIQSRRSDKTFPLIAPSTNTINNTWRSKWRGERGMREEPYPRKLKHCKSKS